MSAFIFWFTLFLVSVVGSNFAQAEEPKIETNFINGKTLDGWKGNDGFWSIENGIIVGHADEHVHKNEFLWSDVEVADFYLSVDVKLTPNSCNAGIQFRSVSINDHGQAFGYQADVGKNIWGRLYHEHGRGELDWRGRGEKAVKPGEWNHYEILAVGDRIWTAVNGTLSVSVKDPTGEKRGLISLQIHSGPPQTVRYRINKLVHDPEVSIAGKTEDELNQELILLKRKPNFVVIYTDDQGYGDLSCFGSKTIKTPHIDRIAKEGRKFTNFTMPTALCTPSRASLLTGSYAKRVGMHEWVLLPQSKKGLHPREHTIADQLKGEGYKTACFGKWHLGHHKETLPHHNGFDTWFGIPYSNDMNHPDNQGKPKLSIDGLDALWKDQESTLAKWKTPLMENDEIVELPVDQRTITRRYTDKTINFIKKNKSKPFFVYLPHTMPHLPLYVPDEYYDPDPKKAYLKTMEHLDAEVGRLMDSIREMGLAEHTYVIFTSDNGPARGNRHHAGDTGGLRGQKTTTFEGGTRVPCVIWGPGRIPADTTCDELMTTLDILPTIASLAESELPKNRKIDGVDASALLTDVKATSPRKEMLYYSGHGDLAGLRQGDWKLLVKKNQTFLFNLADDVIENNNLAQVKGDLVKKMTARMQELGAEVDANTRAPWEKNENFSEAPSVLDFDDPKKVLPHAVDAESVQIVPSMVGGQAVKLDGRQTRLEFLPTLNWQMDNGPFTVSVWVKPDSMRKAGILSCGGYGWRHGWLLDMHPNGSVRFETSNRNNKSNGSVMTKPGAVKTGQWTHLAVAVHSNHWVDVFVNGELVAKDQLKGIDLANPKVKLVIGGIENSSSNNFHGTIDYVQCIAGNAQSPSEIGGHYLPIRSKMDRDPNAGPEALKRFSDDRQTSSPKKPFVDGKFTLEEDEVVVFMGQTDMVRSRLDGTLESYLAAQFAQQKPLFRNMAWESDTVYEQWRDVDFGSWKDQLGAAGASVVIAQFGQVEALEGTARLDDFINAYESLLDEISKQTQRVVLISPRPFEKPASEHMKDNRDQNDAVKSYTDAIRKIAESRKALFVDLSSQPTTLTTNGLHLLDQSQPLIADQIARALGIISSDPTSDRFPWHTSYLKPAILEKNRLWYDNWRPMNWSFAFGDRTTQRFGQAGGDQPQLKSELEGFRPLIAEADKRVQQAALGKKVKLAPAPVTQPQPTSASFSPEDQQAAFKVAEGFEINLFASEADGVVKPVQMRWDDQGRLWVICIPTYPHIEPGLRPGDYILVCEDTDGDGRADQFDRFAEGLFIPMGIEFGDGGIYVCEATELVHLKDADGDGKADQRTVILSGFGTADSHQMINGLERGPLGDLWFTQGHHAYSRVETPYGISKLEKSGVWRYRPRTGKLDGFFNKSTAGLNGQGITHDDWGQTFHNSGAGSGGFYTTAGAIASDKTRGMWPITPNPSRNSGIEFIGTKHLPDEMQGDLVWGAFMSNSVERRKVSDDGSGFKAEKLPDLVQSERQEFRPVNARIGPDGAIYICDWFNLTIGHYQASYRDPKRDRSHGRIWRITAKDRPLVKAPQFDGLGVSQLLELLRSPERLTRVNTKKRLFDLPTSEVVPITKQWFQDLDPKAADFSHLVYEISGIFAAHEVVWPELVQKMMQMEDPRVRAIGTRLIGRWAPRLENPLGLLAQSAADKHPRVRLETILACAEIATPKAVETMARVLDQPMDRYLNYTFSLAVRALKPIWLSGLQNGELTFSKNPEHLKALLTESGGGDTIKIVRDLAASKDPGSLALLVRLGNAQDLESTLKHGGQSPQVLGALLEMARIHGKKPSGDLVTPLRSILEKNNPATQALALSLVGVWEVQALAERVSSTLKDAGASEADHLAALQAATSLQIAGLEEICERFGTVGEPAALRNEAIAFLVRINPEKAAALTHKALPLLKNTASMTPLLSVLITGPRKGEELAALLKKEPLNSETLALVQQALSLTGQNSASLQEVIMAAQGITDQVPAQYNEAYVKQLVSQIEAKGDFARGQAAYLKVGSCVACHQIEGVGGIMGPDLTEVGAGRSLELLIESVLWPNRQIREGYMTTRLTTKDGKTHMGYWLSEENGVVTLRNIAAPIEQKIAKAEIVQKEDAGSGMPAGLTATLNKQELADLIAYLSGLKKK